MVWEVLLFRSRGAAHTGALEAGIMGAAVEFVCPKCIWVSQLCNESPVLGLLSFNSFSVKRKLGPLQKRLVPDKERGKHAQSQG